MAAPAPAPSLAASRRPERLVVGVLGLAVAMALCAWLWGDFGGYFTHPARLLASVGFIALIVAGDQTSGFEAGRREDRGNRWVVLPMLLLGGVMVWLPPYAERQRWLLIDGDAARYAGLALFLIGGVLRVVPMFVLGRRFSLLVTIQRGHQLVTNGIYSVVRHPSYLGALLLLAGWALVFRSGVGLLVEIGLLVLVLARIHAEEALLASEFGEEYAAYRRRTWRLVPFVY